jgi:hypothetical protein
MRFPLPIAVGVVFGSLGFGSCRGSVRSALAAETARDVETDHFDGADDGGPRSWGFALRPLDLDLGLVGVELDAALGERVVLSFESAWLATGPALAYGVVAGIAVFPTRFAFHGFYVHPRLEAWRGPASGNALGLGCLVGYEWTAPVGATVRLGGGLAYVTWTGPPGIVPPLSIAGLLPELDAAVGWVF